MRKSGKEDLTVSINLTCPNGHTLKAKETNAGKVGKCPVCKATVTIPVPNQTVLSESAILDILGNPEPKTGSFAKTVARPASAGAAAAAAGIMTKSAAIREPLVSDSMTGTISTIKQCPSCEREIDIGYHICPHCHTYITGLSDF